jgi:hypothetical protein
LLSVPAYPLGTRHSLATPEKHRAAVGLLEAEFAGHGDRACVGFHRLRVDQYERLLLKLAERLAD